MTLYDLYTHSKVLSNLFFTEVTVKGDYKVSGFEHFGYIKTLRKGAKGNIDVYFKRGHQLIGISKEQVVIQE